MLISANRFISIYFNKVYGGIKMDENLIMKAIQIAKENRDSFYTTLLQ